MNKVKTGPQIIHTPGGEDMVVIPRSIFDALTHYDEDAEDIAASNRARARMKEHGWEPVGLKAVKAILADENPIVVLRKDRRMTAAELAKQAGISRGYLSQIETGQRDGTFETMQKIADALQVSLDLLRTDKPQLRKSSVKRPSSIVREGNSIRLPGKKM